MKLFHYILSFFYLTPQNRHDLVTKNIGYFHFTFNKKFSNVNYINKEDLRQECYYGFVKAANNYDPSYNVSFLIYSRYYIHGYGLNALKKYNNNNKINTVSLDEKLVKNYKEPEYHSLDAIDNFIEYCNESKYGYLLKEYYYNKLSYVKISKKYNMSRHKISKISKKEMLLFKRRYDY